MDRGVTRTSPAASIGAKDRVSMHPETILGQAPRLRVSTLPQTLSLAWDGRGPCRKQERGGTLRAEAELQRMIRQPTTRKPFGFHDKQPRQLLNNHDKQQLLMHQHFYIYIHTHPPGGMGGFLK